MNPEPRRKEPVEPGDETALVVAAQGGDESAFAEIVRRYQRSVYRVAYGLTRSPSDADDLAQETFVRAWQAFGRFRAGALNFAGNRKWWETTVTPVRGSGTEPERLLAISRDVTDARLADEKFRLLFETTADAHVLFDGLSIIDCNRAAVLMLRFPDKPTVLSTPFARLSPARQPDGAKSEDKIADVLRQARECGEFNTEWVLSRRDGDEFPVDLSLTPVELAGKPAILAVWRDLTERKRAELALRESEDRFKAFMNHSPTVAFIKDDAGRYVFVNRPFEEHFGVEFEVDVQGKTDADWLPAEIAKVIAESDRKVLLTDMPSRMVEAVPGADGKVHAMLTVPQGAGKIEVRAVLLSPNGNELWSETRALDVSG